MEYCGAGSVSDIINIMNKGISENQIARIVRDALRGLAYLHQKGCIHRDVKAGNIVLNTQGDSKLGTFFFFFFFFPYFPLPPSLTFSLLDLRAPPIYVFQWILGLLVRSRTRR